MKHLLFSLLMLAMTSAVFAQGKAKMIAIDDIDTSEMEDEFQVLSPQKGSSVLPDKDERDKFFGDLPQIKTWDEWDKDLFYMDLKNKSLEVLVEKYPNFSKKQLKDLKEKRK